jgi:hypothetical protein
MWNTFVALLHYFFKTVPQWSLINHLTMATNSSKNVVDLNQAMLQQLLHLLLLIQPMHK